MGGRPSPYLAKYWIGWLAGLAGVVVRAYAYFAYRSVPHLSRANGLLSDELGHETARGAAVKVGARCVLFGVTRTPSALEHPRNPRGRASLDRPRSAPGWGPVAPVTG